MNPPKFLPWIARRSGVPVPRAEELWTEALRYATEHTGPIETSDYWKTANNRWLALIEAERSISDKAGTDGDPGPIARAMHAAAIQVERPLEGHARFPAERRYGGGPLRASCTIAINFCLTHKSVSCTASTPRLSSTGAVSDDAECRLVCRLLKIAPAECLGGGL